MTWYFHHDTQEYTIYICVFKKKNTHYLFYMQTYILIPNVHTAVIDIYITNYTHLY